MRDTIYAHILMRKLEKNILSLRCAHLTEKNIELYAILIISINGSIFILLILSISRNRDICDDEIRESMTLFWRRNIEQKDRTKNARECREKILRKVTRKRRIGDHIYENRIWVTLEIREKFLCQRFRRKTFSDIYIDHDRIISLARCPKKVSCRIRVKMNLWRKCFFKKIFFSNILKWAIDIDDIDLCDMIRLGELIRKSKTRRPDYENFFIFTLKESMLQLDNIWEKALAKTCIDPRWECAILGKNPIDSCIVNPNIVVRICGGIYRTSTENWLLKKRKNTENKNHDTPYIPRRNFSISNHHNSDPWEDTRVQCRGVCDTNQRKEKTRSQHRSEKRSDSGKK